MNDKSKALRQRSSTEFSRESPCDRICLRHQKEGSAACSEFTIFLFWFIPTSTAVTLFVLYWNDECGIVSLRIPLLIFFGWWFLIRMMRYCGRLFNCIETPMSKVVTCQREQTRAIVPTASPDTSPNMESRSVPFAKSHTVTEGIDILVSKSSEPKPPIPEEEPVQVKDIDVDDIISRSVEKHRQRERARSEELQRIRKEKEEKIKRLKEAQSQYVKEDDSEPLLYVDIYRQCVYVWRLVSFVGALVLLVMWLVAFDECGARRQARSALYFLALATALYIIIWCCSTIGAVIYYVSSVIVFWFADEAKTCFAGFECGCVKVCAITCCFCNLPCLLCVWIVDMLLTCLDWLCGTKTKKYVTDHLSSVAQDNLDTIPALSDIQQQFTGRGERPLTIGEDVTYEFDNKGSPSPKDDDPFSAGRGNGLQMRAPKRVQSDSSQFRADSPSIDVGTVSVPVVVLEGNEVSFKE